MLAIYAGILGGILVGIFIGYFIFQELQARRNLEMRILALEKQTQGKRHTHSTISGLEQAQAVVVDLTFEAEAMNARLDTLRRYLNLVRESPHAFPIDPPAGRRPAGMDR